MPDEGSHLNESLRKIVKGAGIVFIGTFIGLFLGYLSRMVIGRWLGTSDYGLISLAFAGISIALTLSMLGLTSGITRYVSFYKGKNDMGRIKGTIIGAVKITLPMSLIFAFIFYFGAEWISLNVFHEPGLTEVLRIFSIAIPFYVLTLNFLCTINGFQYMQYSVYTEHIFQNTFKILVIVILLILGFGVTGAAWGWVLAIVLMPFLAFYFLEKRVFPLLNTKIRASPMERDFYPWNSFQNIYIRSPQ